jgi:TolB-like protein
LPSKPSIAVLPFKNISGDPGKEYLADAITEDIVTALSHWRWFFVIARNSSFAYKDRDIDATRVGQELGVRYVLAGSVAAAGARVRVSARLVDAITGSNVWADKLDHELVDVFALQDEITERVVAAIEPAMLHGEGVRVERKSSADFSALDCFYRGMWCLNQMTDEADVEALAFFREAIQLDPTLALGHIGAARIHYWRSICGVADAPQDELRMSLASARTAIGLDQREAMAYFAAAGALLYLGEHAAALEDARRSVALNANFAYARYRLGQVLIFGGHPEQAIAPIERSLRLSPYDPQLGPMLETLALAHYQAGDYESAAVHAASAGRVSDSGRSVLAAALAQLGRADEAARVLARAQHARPSQQRPLAAPYANPAHLEHLKQGVRMAGALGVA